jgi:hypothetical protein
MFFLLFFYFLFILKIFQSYIVIPFEKDSIPINKDFNFIKFFTQNEFYILLEIGNPSQLLKTYLFFSESCFFINNQFFNKSLSKTFTSNNNIIEFEVSNFFTEGTLSNDKITILNNNKKFEIQNMTFPLVYEQNPNYKRYFSSIFGLRPDEYLNFIYQLKKQKIINSYVFTLEFNDNNKEKNKIIIGNYPHEYNNKKYNIDYFHFGKVYINNDNLIWQFTINNFKVGNKVLEKNIFCDFNPTFEGLIGTNTFEKYIDEIYFEKKIKEKKCFKDTENYYSYYYCNELKDFNDISLYFEQNDIGYTFEINSKELFRKFNNKYYFMVIFDNFSSNKWCFGEIFLRKYKMTFDQENKIIGFYKSPKTEIKNIFIYKFIVFLLIIIICSLLLIYYFVKKKYIFKRNKIFLNEMIETSGYNSFSK